MQVSLSKLPQNLKLPLANDRVADLQAVDTERSLDVDLAGSSGLQVQILAPIASRRIDGVVAKANPLRSIAVPKLHAIVGREVSGDVQALDGVRMGPGAVTL